MIAIAMADCSLRREPTLGPQRTVRPTTRTSLEYSVRMKNWGVFVVALVVAAFPASAVAKPGHFVTPAERTAEFKLHGSNGYAISVQTAAARQPSRGRVSVIAKSGPASVAYVVRGSLARDDSISVRLPHVGRIAVRFEPVHVGHVQAPDNCQARPSVVEYGYFRGTIELHGERGYTEVERTSAPGTVTQSFRRVCSDAGTGGKATHVTAKFLLAGGGGNGGVLNFTAGSFDVGSTTVGPVFTATAIRIREGMAVSTSVQARGGAADFVTSEPGAPKAAEVKPPRPFEGSAAFHLISPHKSTWEGDLAVEMPGIGRVALAGPDFSSALCENSSCTKTMPGAGMFGSFFAQIIS
ncbi:MAG: hypothetical protein JST31_11965 [Actinobacteria bacterium]|nr:hypothetical protein [Actinomycetota bacterium]